MASLKDFFSRPTGSKKVLAFDGGGVRAIAGLIFLQKLEVESGKKISDMFDMFVGVSAGALNALCFGVNEMTAKETKDYWSKEYIDEITSSNFFWDKASIIQARPKYENTGRIEVLKKIFYDKSFSKPVSSIIPMMSCLSQPIPPHEEDLLPLIFLVLIPVPILRISIFLV